MSSTSLPQFTNVQGPTQEVCIRGRPVKDLFFFSNSLAGTVFGIVSYNGYITLSALKDESLNLNLSELVEEFRLEVLEQNRVVKAGNFPLPVVNRIETVKDITVVSFIMISMFVMFPAWLFVSFCTLVGFLFMKI